MKHIIPLMLPINTEEAQLVMTKSNGEWFSTIRISAKGREIVSVDFGNLPPDTYSCRLMVNNHEVQKRELIVEV